MAYRKQKIASVFIDTETLGKWDDAVILTIGLTFIKDKDNHSTDMNELYSKLLKENSIEFKLDVRSQVEAGRKIEQGVFDWWKTQGDSAKCILKPLPDDIKVVNIFDVISAWLITNGLTWQTVRFFDRNAFDMKKLQHLFEVTLNLGKYPPWDYQDVWEIATLLNFMDDGRYGFMPPKEFNHPEFIYHSAKCDAALDAIRFIKMFQK